MTTVAHKSFEFPLHQLLVYNLVNGLNPRSISYLSGVIVWVRVVFRKTDGKWFESRSISCLSSVIVRMSSLQKDLLVTDVSTT